MNIFSYNSYKNILNLLKLNGKIYRFNDEIACNGILLRHDIDFDINKAFILSQIENDMEVKSTYFVLTSSDYYNPASKQNRSLLQKMNNLGFEIGLHFDCSVYGEINLDQMTKKVQIEKSILEDIIGNQVPSISLHAPSVNNQFPVFEGYNNAYSDKFFNPERYISDSCMNFREKNIYEFINKAKTNLIQVLLHPIHFSNKGYNYVSIFYEYFKGRINDFDTEIRLLNKTYNKEIGKMVLFDILNKGDSYE